MRRITGDPVHACVHHLPPAPPELQTVGVSRGAALVLVVAALCSGGIAVEEPDAVNEEDDPALPGLPVDDPAGVAGSGVGVPGNPGFMAVEAGKEVAGGILGVALPRIAERQEEDGGALLLDRGVVIELVAKDRFLDGGDGIVVALHASGVKAHGKR